MKKQEKACKEKRKFSLKKTLIWVGTGLVVVGGTVYLVKKNGGLKETGKKIKDLFTKKSKTVEGIVIEEEVYLNPEPRTEKKGYWVRGKNWSRTDRPFNNNERSQVKQ